MQIDTIMQIKQLLEQFRTADAVIAAEDKKQGFFDLPRAQAARRIKTYEDLNLPKEIRLTDAIANYIITDQVAHLTRAEKIDRERKPLGHSLKTVSHMIGIALSPITGGQSVPYHIARIASHQLQLNDIEKEYEKIWAQRDEIAGKVLSKYMLTQDSSGNYVLKIGEWVWRQLSVAQSLSYENIGLDPKIDKTKFASLPNPNDLGKSR